MKGTILFNNVKKALLKKPKVKTAYDKEYVRAKVALQVAKLRENNHLTQSELARRLHTTQQTVSKIEQVSHNVTIETLERIASIFHKELQIKFV